LALMDPGKKMTSSTETTRRTRASDTCMHHLAMCPVFSKNDGKGRAMSFYASCRVCLGKGREGEQANQLTL
jgi:hypothetical protein